MGVSIEAPSVAEYERSLPKGFASHPECEAKASLLRTAIQDPRLDPSALPDALRELVANPPPITAWIPEVLHIGLTLAIRDDHVKMGRPDAFFDWIAAKNREVFTSPSYAPMARGKHDREQLLAAVSSGWSRFHRGTELTVSDTFERGASLVLRSPPGLFPTIASQVHAISLRIAFEAAGMADVQLRFVLRRPGVGEYQLTWPDGSD